MRLVCEQLDIRIGSTQVCKNLNLQMSSGEHWAILGENGTGKTTLLHTLAGLHEPSSGKLLLQGKLLQDYSRRQLAQQIGILLQQENDTFPATVMENTLIGRHPYLGLLEWEGEHDKQLAEESLRHVELLSCQDRDINTLSGGEQRRTTIARLLTQNAPVALLDEPSNHLDIRHQISILNHIQQQYRERLTIMATHDVNLALRYCSHVLMLLGNGETCTGPVHEVINCEQLEQLYHIPFREIKDQQHRLFFPAMS